MLKDDFFLTYKSIENNGIQAQLNKYHEIIELAPVTQFFQNEEQNLFSNIQNVISAHEEIASSGLNIHEAYSYLINTFKKTSELPNESEDFLKIVDNSFLFD